MSFKELFGQENIKDRMIHEALNRRGSSFVVSGPKGMGKHSFARNFAQSVICENPGEDGACGKCKCCIYMASNTLPDYKEFENTKGKSIITVDDVKNLIVSDSEIAPQISRTKVYMINADNLNNEGQNALLKTLEEPPHNVVFILLVSDTSSLASTINSRVVEYRLEPYSIADTKAIIASKGVEADESKIDAVCEFSGGNPGLALEILGDETFEKEKSEMLDMILEIPTCSFADLLLDQYDFWDKRKKRYDELLLFVQWALYAIMKTSVSPDSSKDTEEDSKIRKFLRENPQVNKTSVGKALEAVPEFKRAMNVNANYEGAVCALLLKIRKELMR